MGEFSDLINPNRNILKEDQWWGRESKYQKREENVRDIRRRESIDQSG